jgi:hypothetical protein
MMNDEMMNDELKATGSYFIVHRSDFVVQLSAPARRMACDRAGFVRPAVLRKCCLTLLCAPAIIVFRRTRAPHAAPEQSFPGHIQSHKL